MKIAIISDIHNNLVNLEKCLKTPAVMACATLICCGDVTNLETLEFLSQNFKGQIYLIQGNGETFSDKEARSFSNINYLGKYGVFNLEGLRIGLCHEPEYILKLLEEHKNLQLISYGHTHKPWLKTQDGVELINPGTLGQGFPTSTFAVYDTIDKELKLEMV